MREILTPVNRDRLWQDLMALAAITDPDQPYTRRSFSGHFLEGREWLKRRIATDVAALEKAHAGAWERDTTAEEEALILESKRQARAALRARR